MQYSVGFLLLFISCGVLAAGSNNDKLVGTWKSTRPEYRCTETMTFRGDGTLSAISGEENTENQYTLAAPPSAGGRYTLTIRVVKDNGGKDCIGSTVDDTGRTEVVYLEFLSETQMKMCSANGHCHIWTMH